MRFWADLPIAQWIYVKKDPLHKAPFSVIVADFVRARYTTESEANDLVERLTKAFQEPT
jgi:hypothetical protein